MNRDHRKEINAITDRLIKVMASFDVEGDNTLQITTELIAGCRTDLLEIRDDVEAVQADEQEYFDNMIEAFQASERGQQAEDAIENLGNAQSMVGEALDALEEALKEDNKIEGAAAAFGYMQDAVAELECASS